MTFFVLYAIYIKPKLFPDPPEITSAEKSSPNTNFNTITEGLKTSFIVSGVGLALAIFGAAAYCWRPAPPRSGNRNVRYKWILSRSFLAIIIRLIVNVCIIEGPEKWLPILGLILYFPVVLTTIMVSVTLSSGKSVTRGSIGPIMLGMAGGGAYSIISCLLLAHVGYYALNVAISFILSVLAVNVPAYFYLSWRNEVVNGKVATSSEKTDKNEKQ